MSEIKITRKILDEYRDMQKKHIIPLLELELKLMKEGDNGFDNSTIFDYRDGFPRPQSVVGFDWELYEKRNEALNQKKELSKAAEKWIEDIEEGQTRCVFRMFYRDVMEWGKIAIKTGYSKSPDYPRKMIRDAYFEKYGIS